MKKRKKRRLTRPPQKNQVATAISAKRRNTPLARDRLIGGSTYFKKQMTRLWGNLTAAFVYLKKPISAIVVCGGLLSAAHAILLQMPGVEINLSEPSDPNDPFSVKITIKNRVDYTLEDVSSYVGLCQIFGGIVYATYGEDCTGRSKSVIFGTKSWQEHRLIRGDWFEQDLIEVVGPMLGPNLAQVRRDFVSADISIIVTSRPWFEPRWLTKLLTRINGSWVHRDERLLQGRRGAASGKVTWRVKSLDKAD